MEMFSSLSEKLNNAFKKFRNKGKLSEADVRDGMREVKLALLEADGNFKVVRAFVKTVTDRAVGAEVLISSHVMKFTSPERVLEIALEQQRRGADICKIVVGAENMSEQIENLKIATMLREKLSIPFLFLSGGDTRILRRFGGELGCCMYLCVHEHDALATPAQPLVKCVKYIRDEE